MKVKDLLQICSATLLGGDPESPLEDIATDTRSLKPGEVFFALRGERYNGNDYVLEALKMGARGVVAERYPSGPRALPPGAFAVQVRDSLEALAEVGRFHRQAFQGEVLAVTGSVGKSTAKEYIASVLERRFRTLKTPLSYNNEIGVPLTLSRINGNAEVVVLEFGMRKPGDILWLCERAQPTIGVITTIAPTHIGLLGSMDAIVDAKGELLWNLTGRNLSILNADDPYFHVLKHKCRGDIRTYGKRGEISFELKEFGEDGRCRFWVRTPEWREEVRAPLPGEFQGYPLASAVAVGLSLGIPQGDILQGILSCPPLPHRMNLLVLKKNCTLVDDTYNANPASMEEAFRFVAQIGAGKKKIAILADMLELGDYASKYHRNIGNQLGDFGFQSFLACGDAMKEAVEEAKKGGVESQWYADFPSLLEDVKKENWQDSVILVKGSRATGMERMVEEILKASGVRGE